MADVTKQFFEGFNEAGEVFGGARIGQPDKTNPYISSSPAHMAFEAGRMACRCWYPEEIDKATTGRGYSVNVHLKAEKKPQRLLVDYDKKQVTRAVQQ